MIMRSTVAQAIEEIVDSEACSTALTTVDGLQHEVSWSHEIGQALLVNGQTVPSARFWEAVIDGQDEDELLNIAMEGAVYATETRKVAVVTNKEPQPGDELLATCDYEDWYIVRRVEAVRIRPFMTGTMARFECQPTDAAMAKLFEIMEEHGREAVAMVDRKVFFLKTGTRESLFKALGVQEDLATNAHLMVRIGVLMKRPGGLNLELTLPSEYFDEDTNDGTILITEQLDQPRPGTMLVRHDGKTYFLKGMARPPLIIADMIEEESVVRQAQFGVSLSNLPEGTTGAFSPVRTLPAERHSLNYQAIMFGTEHPEKVIEADNQRLGNMQLSDMFSPEDMQKVDAGIPPALLMRKYAPWKWMTQTAVKGARATVYGCPLVSKGEVWLLPDTAKQIEKECDDGIPPFLILHRDPATPGSNSMGCYQVGGVASWFGKGGGHGFVLNPKDEEWKRAGGDFDGDAAVGFEPTFERAALNAEMEELRRRIGTPLLKYNGKTSVKATLIKMANGFSSRLGPAVLVSLRLKEAGVLTPQREAKAHSLIQAAVDAKKHPVDVLRGYQIYRELRRDMEDAVPTGGYMLDALQDVKRQRGEDAKVDAWRRLGNWFKEHGSRSELTKVMAERYQLLTNIFATTEWLKGDDVVLPPEMKDAALTKLVETGKDVPAQMEAIQWMSREYRTAVSEFANAVDDEAKAIAREKVQQARLKIRLALRDGTITEDALVAYGPNRMAAELVSVAAFQSLKAKCKFVQITLFGIWEDSVCTMESIDPIPSETAKLSLVPEEADQVEVKVLKVHNRVTRVILSWA